MTVLRKDEAQVDLILVDLETAAMSFSTFLRIKADAPKMCKIPAVVVLTENSEENKNAVLRMGAKGFFLKPFAPAVVRRRVANILHAARPSMPEDCGKEEMSFVG